MNFAGGHFDKFAGACEFVSALAVDFDGREIGNALFGFAEEVLHNFFHSSTIWYRTVFGSSDSPFWVTGGRGSTKMDGGDIFLVEFEKSVGMFGPLANEENKKTSSKGVESAGMTDFDLATFFTDDAIFAFDGDGASLVGKLPTDTGDNTKRANAGGFINQH